MDCPGGILEHAQAVDIGERRGQLAQVAQLAAAAVDGEQLQAVMVTVAGHGQVDQLATEVEAGAHIDVVHPPDAQVLQLLAGQVIGQQAALFVGAQHAALARVTRVHPDRRIIGGIAQARDRIGLHLHRQNRQCRLRFRGLRLPVQLPALQAVVVAHQQFQAARNRSHAEALRFVQLAQGQYGLSLPAGLVTLIAVQAVAFRVQRQHPARHHGHACERLADITERLHQAYRLAHQIGLGVGGVGPQADVFFVDIQAFGLIVDLAILAGRRQAHATYTFGCQQRDLVLGHQPLLADTFLADQKDKGVMRRIAVQAQAIDLVSRARQINRLAPTPILQVDQHGLLTVDVQGRHQQPARADPVIDAGKGAGQLAEGRALLIEHEQALFLAALQALGTWPEAVAGQPLRRLDRVHARTGQRLQVQGYGGVFDHRALARTQGNQAGEQQVFPQKRKVHTNKSLIEDLTLQRARRLKPPASTGVRSG